MIKTYTENELQQARETSIHSLLGVRGGREISVKCPFHSDNSPSLRVYPDNSYYCFGCEAHGHNAIDFLMDMGLSFRDAIEELKTYIK